MPGASTSGTSAMTSISAGCQSAPSHDAGGNPTSYEPRNAFDGRPDTAWRCDGDASGQSLQVTFSKPVAISQLGLLPGLAKIDSHDGTDRYLQNRRISMARYTFDDGSSVDQSLDTSPSTRSVQSISFPTHTTTSLTITVLSTVPGSAVGDQDASDRTAISEVEIRS